MKIQIFNKEDQAYGAFNNGEIIENKPIGFPREGGKLKPYTNLFYWANAIAKVDSTIGLHPHKGFEIMSFVLNGKIKHYDTKINTWKELSKGDVQIIRAGNGISHSEFMEEGSRMFQIWLDPGLQKSLRKEASYDDYQQSQFPIAKDHKTEVTTLIGKGSPLWLDSEGVETKRIKILNSSFEVATTNEFVHSLYVLEGSFSINGIETKVDDFVLLDDVEKLVFEGDGELFLFSTSRNLTYKTYSESLQ